MIISLNDKDSAHIEALREQFPEHEFRANMDFTTAAANTLDDQSAFYSVQSALAVLRGEVDD